MDWSLEFVGISQSDLGTVFKYSPKKSKVVAVQSGGKVCLFRAGEISRE